MIAWLALSALIAFILWAAWLGSKCGENGRKADQHNAYGGLSGGTTDYGPLTDDEMAGHEALLREMDQ